MHANQIAPSDLHLAIIRHNPRAVLSNLSAQGVMVHPQMDEYEMLDALYSLDQGDFEEFTSKLSQVLNVPIDEEVEGVQELLFLTASNLGCVVKCNALANAPGSYQMVDSEELGRLRIMAMIGLFSVMVFAAAFVLRVIRKGK